MGEGRRVVSKFACARNVIENASLAAGNWANKSICRLAARLRHDDHVAICKRPEAASLFALSIPLPPYWGTHDSGNTCCQRVAQLICDPATCTGFKCKFPCAPRHVASSAPRGFVCIYPIYSQSITWNTFGTSLHFFLSSLEQLVEVHLVHVLLCIRSSASLLLWDQCLLLAINNMCTK